MWVNDGCPLCGVPRFLGSVFVYEAIWIPCCAEWFEWDFSGAVCRLLYAWVGIRVGGMTAYELWVCIAEFEGNGWGCASCKLGDDSVECGKDVWSVE